MKTIIAGTDFSSSSENACKYAAFLAQKLHCKLMVFNLFQAPVLHSNSGLYGISFVSVKKTSEKNTADVAKRLSKEFPSLKIETLSTTGGFEEQLEGIIARHQIAAVLMGLETKDKISKFIWGTHGISIAGKIKAPVILVPQKYKDHHLETILVAVDNCDKLKGTSLKEIEVLVKSMRIQVKLLHVRTPDEVVNPAKSLSVMVNKQKLEVKVQKSKSIEDGIRFFCRDNEIDMVAIISRKHSVFYNLFKEAITKRVAFSAKVPIMAIHE